MAYKVGDVVSVWTPDAVRRGKLARILQVNPSRLSEEDFREYVVEFPDVVSERFRFCVYREFELRQDGFENKA
jgi:hypothetical protein